MKTADTTIDIYGRVDLGGNTAKTKVLEELAARIARGGGLRILDVGCVGPRPLEFWAPLLETPALDFELTGIDVAGIAPARRMVYERGWQQRVRLVEGSGYDLGRLVEPGSFDIAVATQVLEHVARLGDFVGEVARALKPDGECFFTADSAHFEARFSPRRPVRLAKNAVRQMLAWAGDERHYDLAWRDEEIAAACEGCGLEVLELRFYNAPPLKRMHNRMAPGRDRNEVMRRWLALEEALNGDDGAGGRDKGEFLDLYVRARKR